MKTLETQRTLIRQLTEKDRAQCRELLSKEFDYYYGPFYDNPDPDMRFDWIVSLTYWESAGNLYGDRAIELKSTGQIIGLCGIDPWVWKAKVKRYFPKLFAELNVAKPCTTIEFELGYALLKQYRGQGLATEAVKKLIDRSFETAEIQSIFARTSKDNIASKNMMERVGMTVYLSDEYGGFAARIDNPKF